MQVAQVPTSGRGEPGDRPSQCGLARSRFPNQRDHLASAHRQVDPIYRMHRARPATVGDLHVLAADQHVGVADRWLRAYLA